MKLTNEQDKIAKYVKEDASDRITLVSSVAGS